jgi:hypothetical protein
MSGLRVRMIGLLLIAAGVAAAWLFGLRPLQQAQAGADHVEIAQKVFLFAPMAVIFGLAFLIGGGPAGDLMMGPPRTKQQHLAVWPLFALALAAGGLSYWWFEGKLHALGYLGGG